MKMKTMKKLITALVIGLPFAFVFSCQHEPVIPEQQVSFSADILPIIQSNCQQSGCHDTTGGEFPLTNYDNIMDKGEIKSGKPKHSELYKQIESGEMPQSPYPALTERNRKLIYIWIAQGAQNN